MTTPFWCLLIAIFIPYILAGVTVRFRFQQFGAPDVKNPRIQAQALEGAGSRANAAQQNAWEAVAVFGAAVIVAHLAGADAGSSATAAIVFIIARILHPIFYIMDNQPLRTGSFVVGLGSCLWLFYLAAQGSGS